MKRRTWLVVALVAVSLGVLFAAGWGVSDRYQKSHLTIDRSRRLAEGCGLYRNSVRNPARGKYPNTLAELVNPPWAAGPFVLLGPEGLADAWGNPYRYAVVTDAGGEQEVYVWAERVVGGKTRLLGAKRSAGGEVVLFGLPD